MSEPTPSSFNVSDSEQNIEQLRPLTATLPKQSTVLAIMNNLKRLFSAPSHPKASELEVKIAQPLPQTTIIPKNAKVLISVTTF